MRIMLVRNQVERLSKTIVYCPCGGYYGIYHTINNYHNKLRHEKTKIHQDYLTRQVTKCIY